MKCSRCVAELPPHSQFCLRCGAPVAAGSPTTGPVSPSQSFPSGMPLVAARPAVGRTAAVAGLVLALIALLGWSVGAKLLQKPAQSRAGAQLVQAPGGATGGGLVQAPAVTGSGGLVQAPAESKPAPLVQAPAGQSQPTDVMDYLAFLRRVEMSKQELIRSELAAALTTYGNLTPDEVKAASSSNEAGKFLPKVNQDSSDMSDQWDRLTQIFAQRTPPPSCVDLRNAYLDHLSRVQDMFVKIHSAIADAQTDSSRAIQELTQMEGTASADADSSAQRADDALAAVCQQYNLTKDFSIKTDASSASLIH